MQQFGRVPSGEEAYRKPPLGRVAAKTISRLSPLLDFSAMFAALLMASAMSGRAPPDPDLLVSFAMAAFAIWLIGAQALRYYELLGSHRPSLEDVAITSMLVLTVAAVLAMATNFFRIPGLPDVGSFLPVFLLAALMTRGVAFRALSPSLGPIDEVLVVGIGAMGRATAEDLRRRGRQEVLGFARFSNEQVSESFEGKCLGTALELESVLASVRVAEVYLAAVNITHAQEIQDAIQVCERVGVPFAMPPYLFRLERAQPLTSHAITDGYVHYQAGSEKTVQPPFRRGFDTLRAGLALWVAPLLRGGRSAADGSTQSRHHLT